MAKKDKGRIAGPTRELWKLIKKSNDRVTDSLDKVVKGNYGGGDLVTDVIDQWIDVVRSFGGAAPSQRQIGYIYLPADGSAGTWPCVDALTFDDVLQPAELNAYKFSDLMGPVVGGAQKFIPKASVDVVLDPAAGPSAEFRVRVRQAPVAADAGLYRGYMVSANSVIAEIIAYAWI